MPANVKVSVIEGSFDVEMPKLLDAMPPGQSLAPTFAFIDPFGYNDHDLQLSSRILGFKRCEVLVYMPFPFIARFVDQAVDRPRPTRLYGDESWRAARGRQRSPNGGPLSTTVPRRAPPVSQVRAVVRDHRQRPQHGIPPVLRHEQLLGLARMQEAMWKVDPVAGSMFADSTNSGQFVLFADKPDLAPLERDVREPLRGSRVQHRRRLHVYP